MPKKEPETLFTKGIKAIDGGDILSALVFFEKATAIEDTPINSSYLAFCIAKERGQLKKAISMCEKAIKEEPNNSTLYLNLGRIYYIADQRVEALQAFRDGLAHEQNRQIIDELIRLGIRKPPVIPFLKRSNPINKYLGIILTRLGLR